MKPILAEKDLIIQDGKCVYEVRPRSAPHKGTAAAVLRRCVGKKALMVYVGDDRTDEDVFRQLTRRDVGVRVGFARGSKAAYAISAQADVRRFLAQAASCC